MRNWFLTLCILWAPAMLKAQNSNNHMVVTANSSLNFLLTEPSHLETDQVIPNAFTITIISRNSNCSVFAKLSAFSYPPGYVPTSSKIALDWTSDNSNKDYNLVMNPITVETFDKLLFMQKKMGGNKIYDYNYNLMLLEPGYTVVPGNYNFTITFTMTQP